MELKERALSGEDLDAVLGEMSEPAGAPSYGDHIEIMNRCFAKSDMTGICLALKMADDDWATEQACILAKRSPLSLSVTPRAR